MTTLQKRDIVMVPAVVSHETGPDSTFFPNCVYLTPEGHHSGIYVPKKFVSLVRPYFQKGDVVQKADGQQGEVWGTEGDLVWAKFGEQFETLPAKELTRADQRETTPIS